MKIAFHAALALIVGLTAQADIIEVPNSQLHKDRVLNSCDVLKTPSITLEQFDALRASQTPRAPDESVARCVASLQTPFAKILHVSDGRTDFLAEGETLYVCEAGRLYPGSGRTIAMPCGDGALETYELNFRN